MVEKIFSQGLIKVLVCTSTLAWGVNLPAHAVVIRVRIVIFTSNIHLYFTGGFCVLYLNYQRTCLKYVSQHMTYRKCLWQGTEIYDAKHGAFVDLGILDVLQIFGRAGRPQFDTSGHGIIITSHNKLSHYLSLLTNQFPIESSFVNFLADNLNAEVRILELTFVLTFLCEESYSSSSSL